MSNFILFLLFLHEESCKSVVTFNVSNSDMIQHPNYWIIQKKLSK